MLFRSITGGTLTTLIDGESSGTDFGNARIWGLDLVAETVVVGGQTLMPGQILMSFDSPATVGTNAFSVTASDICVVNVSTTGLGTSSVTASMFFRGSDVGLSNSSETLDALTRVAIASAAPQITLRQDAAVYIENAPPIAMDPTAVVVDQDSTNFDQGTLTVFFSGNEIEEDQIGRAHV